MGSRRLEPEWIWRSGKKRANDFAYFRKEFKAKACPSSAILQLSAHHTVQAYLDGERIGGYGSPAPTDSRKRKLYNEHDVTAFFQKDGGVSCLTADALYLGGGGQNYVDGFPGFWLRLTLEYADGSRTFVVSGPSWETLAETPHKSGTPYQQNRRVSAIEDYDANKWDPAWRLPGSGHGLSVVKAKKANAACSAWRLESQLMPEGGIEYEIAPSEIEGTRERTDAGYVQVFDAGRVVSGWPRIRLKGVAGATVRLRYSESVDQRGRVEHRVCNELSDNYYDQYAMRGDDEETWQPAFSFKAFRYVEVTGYPEPIVPGDNLVVCFAHTALDEIGSFRCSEPFLNELFDACIRTQKNNVLGQVVDCPHREQAQYLADTDLQAETLLYNFDAKMTLRKTLADFADAQLEDGSFPFVAPGNYEHEEFRIRIPEWDSHFASLLWKLYEATGDYGLLAEFYEPMKRMVDCFLGRLDPASGLVPKGNGWNISDWPYPTVDDAGSFLTVQQLKLVNALRIVSRSAGLLGREEDRDSYAARAETLRENVVRELFDGSRGAFRDSSESSSAHQGVTAYALFADMVPHEYRAAALEYVAAREWESRTVLSLPLLRTLFDEGKTAEAYALLGRREYPGWGYMISQGAATMWEGWDDIESHSHAWNGYPARLLQEYVAGIRSEAPGFAAAVIRPFLAPDLTFAGADVRTPFGTLSASWEKEDGGRRIRLKTVIPEGMAVRFELPGAPGADMAALPAGKYEWSVMTT